MRALITLVMTLAFWSAGCAALAQKTREVRNSAQAQDRERHLARVGLEMLTPGGSKYDPEKGKAYLEYSLKQGNIKAIEIPAPVLLDLIRSERVASDRSHSLEEQLEIIKEIDRTKEGEL